MLKLSFKTSKKRHETINEAESFFKQNGLVTKEKGACCLLMEGGGGYIRVDLAEGDKQK